MRATRDLPSAMLAFGAALRTAGVAVTTSALMDGVRALEVVDLSDRREVHLALRALLASRMEEHPAFDRCFYAFWRFRPDGLEQADPPAEARSAELPGKQDPGAGEAPAAKKAQGELALDEWEGEEPGADDPLDLPGHSSQEVLMEQDFSTFAADQLEEVARVTVQIAKRLARRAGRRRKPARRRGAVDLRRSMRANLMRGEIVELRRRARRLRKVRLVLLCDVSGSMDLYSQFLLQFLFSLQNVFGRVETFTFATRLTRVTGMLQGRSYLKALARLREVTDWSGGTRIGDSLREFNQAWGSLVDRRTIALVLSDGWDTGDPEVLAQEMLALKRRAGRVIWLNPLLGDPTYEPATRGMVAALPVVDHFAAAHNLASLRELAGHLSVR